jgi:hypothetical protein
MTDELLRTNDELVILLSPFLEDLSLWTFDNCSLAKTRMEPQNIRL